MNEKYLYDKPAAEAIGSSVEFFNTKTGRWNKGRVMGLFQNMVWIIARKDHLFKIQRGFVRLKEDSK